MTAGLADAIFQVIVGSLLLYLLLRPITAGAPYVPTFKGTLRKIIPFAGIRTDDVVYELGCGDGRFSVAAVRAGAARAVGYDVAGLMVFLSRVRSWFADTQDRTRFLTGDIRKLDLGEATLVYLYLLPEITETLASGALRSLKPGARILASSFAINTEKHPFRLLKQERFGSFKVYLYERE
ncbi:MAG TPA: class I SAM-dependent methyltransferase [Candidatus Paceibacterota bacterium]|nr:class I SAM-dependent methyltransferase [Candidatus Paceibacterota bacterium]